MSMSVSRASLERLGRFPRAVVQAPRQALRVPPSRLSPCQDLQTCAAASSRTTQKLMKLTSDQPLYSS